MAILLRISCWKRFAFLHKKVRGVKKRVLMIFPLGEMSQRRKLNVSGLDVSDYGNGLLLEVRRWLSLIDELISKRVRRDRCSYFFALFVTNVPLGGSSTHACDFSRLEM